MFENKKNASFFFFTGAASEDVALWCMLQTGGVFCKQWLYKHGLLWAFFHTRQVGNGKGTVGRIAEQPVFMGCFLSFTVPVPAGLIHMVGVGGGGEGAGGVIHISVSLHQCNLNSHPYSHVN